MVVLVVVVVVIVVVVVVVVVVVTFLGSLFCILVTYWFHFINPNVCPNLPKLKLQNKINSI